MKIKPRISKRVISRFKRMCITALFLGTAAYIGEHHIKEHFSDLVATGDYQFSGLYVNADVLGDEGERILQSTATSNDAGTDLKSQSSPLNSTNP